jgi:fructan beta-fructosidase
MNDPNGLIHHGGRWHAFFQHNPSGDTWGEIGWGHASSPDLVHWTEHPVAIPATEAELAFSGSTLADGDELVAVYTAVDRATGIQAQALARSRDGGLTFERYAGNPVLDRGSRDFRDPKVFRHGDGWVLVAVEARDPKVVLYRSSDLVDWTHLSDLPARGPVATEWECPDLFPLRDEGGREHWVLTLSLTSGEAPQPGGRACYWFLGAFDGTTFAPYDGAEGWLDHGPDCYAAVSFADAPGGRRVLLGWMSNWSYAAEVPTSPYRGTMTAPRELALRGGRLVQRPAAEVAAYARRVRLADGATLELAGARLYRSGDRLVLERSGPAFHPAYAHSACAVVETDDLDILQDETSVEVFSADGVVCLTMLVLPARA